MSRLTRADQKLASLLLSMRCNWRPLPFGSICRSKTLAFTAFWSIPDRRLNDEVKGSAIRKFMGSYPEHFHHLVSEVIDHLNSYPASCGPRERARCVGIKRRPGLF